MKKILITGIRGIPASHGGFETFAESLSLYLVSKGWEVTVYCQESSSDFSQMHESEWKNVRCIHIPVTGASALATIKFDFLTVKHALNESGLVLTLGYNTALFNALFRFKSIVNIINMDGIEWKRDKWKWYERMWLYLNERAGCIIGNHLVADHPEIKRHLSTRVSENKITMIPYGAREVLSADKKRIENFGLSINEYAIVIARPEPENSILEIVRAYSSVPRRHKLVVLGSYDIDNDYHMSVKSSANSDVIFLGAVYDHSDLDALRFFSSIYIHGHTVGGTNPSLIEALGAGQPVLAHDNAFNRWVAGDGAVYFDSEKQCAEALDIVLNSKSHIENMSIKSRQRFSESFSWNKIHDQYESLLSRWVIQE